MNYFQLGHPVYNWETYCDVLNRENMYKGYNWDIR